MKIVISKKEQGDYRNNHSFVTFVHQNKTRCRFSVYGLKNSMAFARYLSDALVNTNGVRNIKPNTITGNVLIEFNPQDTSHKEVFERLQIEVKTFIETEPFSINTGIISKPIPRNKWAFSPYPVKKGYSRHCSHNCISCTDHCFDRLYKSTNYKSTNIDRILSFAFKAAGSLLLQYVAKRFIRQSLYRLIF